MLWNIPVPKIYVNIAPVSFHRIVFLSWRSTNVLLILELAGKQSVAIPVKRNNRAPNVNQKKQAKPNRALKNFRHATVVREVDIRVGLLLKKIVNILS